MSGNWRLRNPRMIAFTRPWKSRREFPGQTHDHRRGFAVSEGAAEDDSSTARDAIAKAHVIENTVFDLNVANPKKANNENRGTLAQ